MLGPVDVQGGDKSQPGAGVGVEHLAADRQIPLHVSTKPGLALMPEKHDVEEHAGRVGRGWLNARASGRDQEAVRAARLAYAQRSALVNAALALRRL